MSRTYRSQASLNRPPPTSATKDRANKRCERTEAMAAADWELSIQLKLGYNAAKSISDYNLQASVLRVIVAAQQLQLENNKHFGPNRQIG